MSFGATAGARRGGGTIVGRSDFISRGQTRPASSPSLGLACDSVLCPSVHACACHSVTVCCGLWCGRPGGLVLGRLGAGSCSVLPVLVHEAGRVRRGRQWGVVWQGQSRPPGESDVAAEA